MKRSQTGLKLRTTPLLLRIILFHHQSRNFLEGEGGVVAVVGEVEVGDKEEEGDKVVIRTVGDEMRGTKPQEQTTTGSHKHLRRWVVECFEMKDTLKVGIN